MSNRRHIRFAEGAPAPPTPPRFGKNQTSIAASIQPVSSHTIPPERGISSTYSHITHYKSHNTRLFPHTTTPVPREHSPRLHTKSTASHRSPCNPRMTRHPSHTSRPGPHITRCQSHNPSPARERQGIGLPSPPNRPFTCFFSGWPGGFWYPPQSPRNSSPPDGRRSRRKSRSG